MNKKNKNKKLINNLASPNTIKSYCNLQDIFQWYDSEISLSNNGVLREIILNVGLNLDSFVKWPKNSVLLWNGCDRIIPPGAKSKYHIYPDTLKAALKKSGLKQDSRNNGPAVAAFEFSGGVRPPRFGSTNGWSIHHIYSGKFPYLNREKTKHAVEEGLHFTQSAGLVAVHPVADSLCDEIPAFNWLLRAESFKRFGYDPDQVFSVSCDTYGFHSQKCVDFLMS